MMGGKWQVGTFQFSNTVVSRFSGLRFSGLSRFSGLFLLLVWQQKWSNYAIGLILLEDCRYLVDFLRRRDGLSPLNRDTTVLCNLFWGAF